MIIFASVALTGMVLFVVFSKPEPRSAVPFREAEEGDYTAVEVLSLASDGHYYSFEPPEGEPGMAMITPENRTEEIQALLDGRRGPSGCTERS